MKIRDVLKLKGQDLSGAVPSAAADRTRTMLAPVQLPDRIVPRGLQDIVPDAGPNDGGTDDPLLAQDPLLTMISPAHRRDLKFIVGQIARLPTPSEQ
jgi:hypothetical protein